MRQRADKAADPSVRADKAADPSVRADKAADPSVLRNLNPLSWPPPPGLHVVSPEQLFSAATPASASLHRSSSPASLGDRHSVIGDLMESLVAARQHGDRVCDRDGGSYPAYMNQQNLEEGLTSGDLLQACVPCQGGCWLLGPIFSEAYMRGRIMDRGSHLIP